MPRDREQEQIRAIDEHVEGQAGEASRETAMTNKQAEPDPDISAMGLIAHGLVQGYLGPDHKVIDMEQFFAALVQALHDAYDQGWKDRSEVEERAK